MRLLKITPLLLLWAVALVSGEVAEASVEVEGQTAAEAHADEAAQEHEVQINGSHGVGRPKPDFLRQQRCYLYDRYYTSFLPAVIATDQCSACMSCEHSPVDLCPSGPRPISQEQVEHFCRDVARPPRIMYGTSHSASKTSKSSSGKSSGGGHDDACDSVCPATCYFNCVKYVNSCCPLGRASGRTLVNFKAAQISPPSKIVTLALNDVTFDEDTPIAPSGEISGEFGGISGTVTNNGQPIYASLASTLGPESASLNLGDIGFFTFIPEPAMPYTATTLALWKSTDFLSSSCAYEATEVSGSVDRETINDILVVTIVIKLAGSWYQSQAVTDDIASGVMLSGLAWDTFNPYTFETGGVVDLSEFTCVEFIGLRTSLIRTAPTTSEDIGVSIVSFEASSV